MRRAATLLLIFAAACDGARVAAVTDGAPEPPDLGHDAAIADAAMPDLAAPIDLTTAPVDLISFADPFAALQNLPPVCSPAGWCWLAPTPSGTFYSRVVSSAPSNIWLVGGGPPSYAAILQWNGFTWTAHKPPVPTCAPSSNCFYPDYLFPMAISTIAPDDTWMVYSNVVEHWDGTQWSIVDIDNSSGITLDGVWVDPTGDAWVTASDGTIKRWHNGAATLYNVGTFAGSIWGTAPDDVFVTSIGALWHYDGTTWQSIYSGGKTAGSYVGARRDVWISGGDGAIFHWDGTAITPFTVAALAAHASVQGADYAAPNDVSWLATGGSAAPAMYIHWDGHTLTPTAVVPPTTSLGDPLCAELGSVRVIGGQWWIVCDYGGVSTMTAPGTMAPVISPWIGTGQIWGTSKNNLYLASGGDLRHWDGTTWTHTSMPIGQIRGLAGAATGGADELFGSHFNFSSGMYTTYLDHFDGASWTATPLTTFTFGQPLLFISTVYPLGPGEAVIVGGGGSAFHYQGGTLTPIAAGTTVDLAGVWGPDADHLIISGAGGTLLDWSRSNPNVFTPDPGFPTTTDDLGAIASAGGTTWIVPANQTYVWMKPAASTWQTIATQVSPISIAAINDHDVVVAASSSGLVSRWNGMKFTVENYPSWQQLNSLFALPDGTTYLTGTSGVVVHP